MEKKTSFNVINEDCLEAMKNMAENSIDAIVTDPPYGIDFMGKGWDHGVPGKPFWEEALRVAKPGAHLLAFGGTRTYHRLACAIEDAGWEIRDCIMWCYSSGFPKSMDISKAINKMKGAEQKKIPKWNGWGTCLKPAVEPIVLARKPVEGTIAENALKYGTGGLNIDACRVPSDEPITIHSPAKKTLFESGHKDLGTWENNNGRFPANFIHDGSEEVVSLFPDNVKGGSWIRTDGARHFNNNGRPTGYVVGGSDKSVGSAARFFYCAKASKAERGEGNDHPTVKPITLMCYLVKLVCPIGGIVLDPFCGSGSTGLACIQENMNFVGCEKETHYAEIANNRIQSLMDEIHPPKPKVNGDPKMDDFNFDTLDSI